MKHCNITLDNDEIDILVGCITREIAELAGIRESLSERGINVVQGGLNVRITILRHLLEYISNATE